MLTGAFAPVSADTKVDHLDSLISYMANDKLPPWFMQVIQGADLLAIDNTQGSGNYKADH
jgi:hypothetical protein